VTDAPVADELLQAVYANPGADGPRSVYSDFLLERGDRLGEFIALQLARTAKGKRTATREKTLMAAEGASWWKDHPCTQFGTLRWEDTARGFPAVFRPGWPVSDEHLGPQERAVIATAGNPAWNTVEALHLSYDLASPGMAELLRSGGFASLRAIDGLNVKILDRIADLPLAVTALELWVREERDLPAVTGFPVLTELTIDMRQGPERVVQALAPSGLLGRLRSLELRGVPSGTVQDAFAAWSSMPPNLERLRLNRFYGQSVTVASDRRRPSVEISMTAHQVDEVVESLRLLDPEAVASVKVTFADGGYFTKRNPPVLAEQIRRSLAKFGDRATLDAG
jgi:uncharacterized protein (TIGR02996 family)